MDALSEVLRLAHFHGNVTLDATGHAPWCMAVPASAAMWRGYAVISGECVLESAAGREPLRPGDFALLSGGDAHLIASSLDADAVSLSSLVRTPVEGEMLPVRIGGTGAATRFVLLTYGCERHLAEQLLSALPRLAKIPLEGAPQLGWLTDALSLVLSASDAPFLGAGVTRGRLAEILLAEAIARYVQALPPGGTGWFAGLNDRYVGRALALVHGRPAEAWTVERLGRQVGLSRSALAARFGEVMGEPIFAYLTRWRLQMAAEYLLTGARPIQSIAKEAGYDSAGAFSAAFKRMFGKPPSIWRRRMARKGGSR